MKKQTWAQLVELDNAATAACAKAGRAYRPQATLFLISGWAFTVLFWVT